MSDLSAQEREASYFGWKGEDTDELRRFLSRMFGPQSRQADIEHSRWLFVEHPHRPAEESALWFLRNDGEIVSMVGFIPFRLEVCGQSYLSVWGVDATSDPRIRDTGVFFEFVVALFELRERVGARAAFGLGSSEDGFRFITRYGFHHVANMPYYLWVADARSFVQSSGLSRAPKWAAVPLLRGFQSVVERLGRVRSKGLDLIPIDEFDHRVDGLWRDVAQELPIGSARDFDWLRWRFDRGPHANDYRRYYLTEGELVVGYLVLRATNWHGRPALAVIDYLARSSRLPALFAFATAVVRADEAAVLLCRTMHPRARSILRSAGFLRGKKEGHQLTALLLEEGPPQEVMFDSRKWFLTAADSDVDL